MKEEHSLEVMFCNKSNAGGLGSFYLQEPRSDGDIPCGNSSLYTYF